MYVVCPASGLYGGDSTCSLLCTCPVNLSNTLSYIFNELSLGDAAGLLTHLQGLVSNN